MKRIGYPLLARGRSALAVAFLGAVALLQFAFCAAASTPPQYGGILRVQIGERVETIDPRQWPSDWRRAAAAEKLAALVFERLVRFDDHGSPQPALAASWQHDVDSKRWQFRLRDAVKFSDGALLTPEAVAMALQQLLGNDFDVSASSDSVVIQADQPQPNFLAQLAGGRYFIFHAAADGTLSGTGPFRVAQWPSGNIPGKIVLTANESCWTGRPFVDGIEISTAVDAQQQANAVAFGQADVVELDASQVRRNAQRGVRTVSSDPVELFALRFDMARPSFHDARLREAISAAIDRVSIAEVVLQRQGVPAGGLLPNWLSGYAFLFNTTMDLPRAKELLTATGREVSRSAALALVYDSADVEARAVAERVAVNLKEAGISVQLSGQIADGKAKVPAADLRLMRRRIASPDIATALPELIRSLGELSDLPLETPEQQYAAERALIDAFRVIPLVHVSEGYGLSPRVRDWMQPRWGGWRLEDVWLDPAPTAGGNAP